MIQRNLIHTIINFAENDLSFGLHNDQTNNRVNDVGSGLEKFIKHLFTGSAEMNEVNLDRIFSHQGEKNHPPDLILRGGDAFEIKKIETPFSDIQLNSSPPRAKLYVDDPKITKSCRTCEDHDWEEKDLFYVIGHTNNDRVQSIFFVQGSCIAPPREIYERVSSAIIDAVLTEVDGLEPAETKELARFNGIDPLRRTKLRVRGMYLLENPFSIWKEFCNFGDERTVAMNFLLKENKYSEFPALDQSRLEQIEDLKTESIKIPSPSSVNDNLNCKFLTISKTVE